jgi:hypothetical protein
MIRLIHIKARIVSTRHKFFPLLPELSLPDMNESAWHLAATAPFDHDLELAVIEGGEVHALVARCRRTQRGWLNAATGRQVDVDPTHWRPWRDGN